MRRGKDEAGNIWELDDAGNPVRLVQPAQASAPGSIGPRGGTFIPAPPKPPEGFRYSTDGKSLEAIPGGPADKAGKAPNPPEGYRWSADGKSLEVIPGGPKDTSSQGDVPPIGDMTKTGKAYFDSLPDSYKGTVRQLLSNHLVLSSFAMAKPYYQAAINAASRIDPSYDPSLAPMRSTALKDFTGAGKASKAVAAVNRLAANLQELKSISDKMGGPNTGIAPLNKVIAGVEQQGMPTLKARYDALVPEIANQFDLIMKTTGSPTVSGIGEAAKALDRARSQDERNGAFQEIVKAVHGAIEPIKDQWDSAYGGTKAPPMWVSKKAGDFFSSVDPANADTYGGNDWRGLPGLHGDALPWELTPFGSGPPGGSGPPPPSGPPAVGGGAPGSLAPKANYSAMVGGNAQSLATTDPNSKLGVFKQTSRNVFDPLAANAVSAFIKRGAPYDTVAAYLQSHGITPNPELPKQYAAALAYQQQNPGATPNVEALKTVPTTLGERLAASPAAAALVGAGTAATAGLTDLAGRAVAGPGWDANRAALAATNPTSDALGNVAGGVAGALAAPELLAKYAPGSLALLTRVGTKLGKFAAPAADAAYGSLYGANENPDNPLLGAGEGGLTALIGGQVGRSATTGLSNLIAPQVGKFGPAYEAGVFPTLGQRIGQSGITGRAVNATEQAMQSFPGLGSLVARARQIPRDAAQVGAFNKALGEIGTKLPDGVGPGTDAHAFAGNAFNQAYDKARSGMQFVADPQYFSDASSLASSPSISVLNDAQKSQLQKFVDNAVVGRLKANGGALNGDQYKAASSEIGSAISKWSKNPDTSLMADALNDYQAIFDNAARRNSPQPAVNALDAADRGYAQLVRIQRASEMGGATKDPGTFSPANFAGAVKQMGGGVRSNAFNRGTALGQDFADAILPLRDTLPNSGTTDRLLTGQALAGVGGAEVGAAGAIASHPGALAPFALYAPGMNKLVTRAIAPRQYTLPPPIADPLNLLGSKVNGLAPYIGAGSVPFALTYQGVAQ